ncbi:MAG TPA: hypothetical protein VMM77_08330 [Gemmatimonadaceae bacterium]|nr:hypothetical protein [Gemmatimonadaceae bacterium]
MDVLMVGGDAALREVVLQLLRTTGLSGAGCEDVSCAREMAAVAPPLALVMDVKLSPVQEGAGCIPILPGGSVILFREGVSAARATQQVFGRALVAELSLPLERARLMTLLQRIVARARITGRDRRAPESPLSP